MVVDDIVVCGRRAAVHDRLHRHRQGRPRADRRDRLRHRRGLRRRPAPPWSAARPPSTPACSGRTSTTSPAPPPASSSTTTSSARTGSVAGDVVVALASSGLHSNGYSLVRRVFAAAGWALDRDVAEFGRTLGEELLEPTRVYARDLLDLIRADGVDVHALSHVTGGGLAANLARVLPRGQLRPGRPLDLDPAGGLRVGARPRPGAAGRPRAHAQPGRRLRRGASPRDQADARGARGGGARPARLGPGRGQRPLRPPAVDDGVEVVQRRQGRRRRLGAGRRAPTRRPERAGPSTGPARGVGVTGLVGRQCASHTRTPPPCGPVLRGRRDRARTRCPVVTQWRGPAGRPGARQRSPEAHLPYSS